MMQKPRDWFVDAFGVAVEDVRHKLVEEGWFGRTVTPATRGMAETLGWEAGPKAGASAQDNASVHVAMMFGPPAAEGEGQKQDEQQQRIRGLSL